MNFNLITIYLTLTNIITLFIIATLTFIFGIIILLEDFYLLYLSKLSFKSKLKLRSNSLFISNINEDYSKFYLDNSLIKFKIVKELSSIFLIFTIGIVISFKIIVDFYRFSHNYS